jgi:hypothetical protein
MWCLLVHLAAQFVGGAWKTSALLDGVGKWWQATAQGHGTDQWVFVCVCVCRGWHEERSRLFVWSVRARHATQNGGQTHVQLLAVSCRCRYMLSEQRGRARVCRSAWRSCRCSPPSPPSSTTRGRIFGGGVKQPCSPFWGQAAGLQRRHAAAQWPRRRFWVCRAARAAPYSASTRDRNPGGGSATRAVERKERTEHAVLKVMQRRRNVYVRACNGLLACCMVSAHDRRPRSLP